MNKDILSIPTGHRIGRKFQKFEVGAATPQPDLTQSVVRV